MLHQVEKKCSTISASEHAPNNGSQGDQCKQEKGQYRVWNNISSQSVVSPTEKESKENKQQNDTTMMSRSIIDCGSIALRTVPVYLKSGNRKLKVNALLDDTSTKTYVNADVAAELGLQGHPQRVNVSVLNGAV